MATRPDYMSNAVRPVRPDYMANAVREGEQPPAPTETTGALGVLGDFLVDSLGGVSATMRDNAQSGVFARDAAKDEGWLDRAGTLFERGAASVDQGLYNFLGGLGSQKARDAAAIMANTTGADVAGSTSWDEANSLGSMANFVADAGVESLPAMGALAVPYAGPAIIGTSQTGNIAADRAANDGRNQITAGDLGEAAPWAIASTALDRLGLKGIKNPVGNTVTGRIAGSAAREGGTEAVQSALEYSGGTVGTQQGFELADMGEQMLAGGVAGFGIGGTARGGVEIAQPALSKVNVRTQRSEPVAGSPEADTDGGSLDDYMNAQRPDYMGDAKPLALPSPEMVERQTRTVTPERREEPTEPQPVDDGVAVAQSIFGDAARITSGYRGPDHPLSRANPRSYHTQTRAAVDMAPIEGMTFDEAKAAIEAQGYTLIEAIDETGSGRTRHATGDHWHFVIGTAGRMEPQGGEFDTGDAPGADGSLLGRGNRQESIAGRIAIPEAAPVEQADPVTLPDETAAEVEADGQRTMPGIPALPEQSQAGMDLTSRREQFLSRYTGTDLAGNPISNNPGMPRDERIVAAALNGEAIGDIDDAALEDMAAEIEAGGDRQAILSRIPGEMLRRVEMADKFVRTAYNARMLERRARGRNAPQVKAAANQELAALAQRAKAMGVNVPKLEGIVDEMLAGTAPAARAPLLTNPPQSATVPTDAQTDQPAGQPATVRPDQGEPDGGPDSSVPTLAGGQLRALGIASELRTRKAAALVGRTASTPKELAEIAQIYRDPRYETFRIFFTKGDTIVHATGVSSRSIAEAPLMPEGVGYFEWLADMEQVKKRAGADGYYLLHNHPSGVPDPSPADKQVTREISSRLEGFRGHVVINSNKFAEIQVDGAGRSRTNIRNLDMGEDNLLKASVPHDALGSKASSGLALAMMAKQLQKPGYVTVIGTTARAEVRVIVEFDEATVKRDPKRLMGMGRTIMRQSGAASLFLVGDRDILKSPNVSRALQAGMVTAAFDTGGRPITDRVARKNKMPVPPGRYVAEDSERFKIDPKPSIIDKLVDREGLTRDAEAIRNIVGNPVDALKSITKGGFAEMGRAYFYTADSRLRGMAKRYNSDAITQLADMFHAQAGKTDRAVSETYHEAVEREGFGRAGQAWRILEPFFKDKAAMDRIGLMLRDPTRRNVTMRKAEKNAAAEVAKLLKDTIDYRKKAGEDIGEVTDGYFPRFMDVEKVVKNRDLFLKQATELYRRHGAENPEASAKAWAARIFDQYAGLDGGLEYASLFRDTRPAGVGRQTTKAREFGKDADTLLGEFYDNDTGSVLTGYFIGAARKAEEARRFGSEATGQEPLQRMMNQIKRDIRASGEDAGDTIEAISRIVSTNLGRISTPPGWLRTAGSVLHTAGQLGTLDRATYTSLSEAMMGFVRAGPKYGIPMVAESARQFARQLRNAPPDKATRMAQFLGIAHDVMIGEALASRNGYEMAQTSRRAQKVQQGFFQATGLHQWTEGTRSAATRMGQQFIADLALDMNGPDAARSGGYLKELGIKDPQAFAQWLNANGDPTPESLTHFSAGPMEEQYRTALVRFVNQTIMKPSRAEKPRWASDPFYGLFFSLLSFSYGFKKNVLDRVGRQGMDAIKTKDPTLLYPALGMAGLFAVHTILQNTLRQAIFGGGREDDEEGISGMDVVEAVDRAGLTGAASRPLNAILSLKYRASVLESMAGPTAGRPAQLIEDVMGLATDANSPNTNTAERKAAGAIYDVVLEPAMEAYGVTRFKKPLAAAVVWGTGNRGGAEGGVDGMLPADRDFFVEALAGPPDK